MIKQENKPLFSVLSMYTKSVPSKIGCTPPKSIYLSKNIQNPDFSELLWWVKVDSEEQRVRQAILARASFILLLQLAQRDHAHIRLLYTQWTRHVKKCNQKCAPLSRLKKNVKNLWFKTVSFTISQFFPRFTFTIWHLPSTLYHLCTVYVTLLSASAMFKAACVCSTRLFHGVLIQTVLVVFMMKQRCDWRFFFSWKLKNKICEMKYLHK